MTIQQNGAEISLIDHIPPKHKLAIRDFDEGDEVIMYGVLVGKTTEPVRKGGLLTTENLHHASNEDYKRTVETVSWNPPDVSVFEGLTFDGYHRSNGDVGTRNYWLFIPMVFCENNNLKIIKDALLTELGYANDNQYRSFVRNLVQPGSKNGIEKVPKDRVFKNIDGIKFLTHEGGCGGTREDSIVLGKLLAGYANHPNVAGVTIMSLGCQHLQLKLFMDLLKETNPDFDKPLLAFEQQSFRTVDDLIRKVLEKTIREIQKANKIERKPAPLSKLILGMECGGSDGFSGISANPSVGRVADFVSVLGGKVLLSEFPELFGAEQDLVDRMVDERLADKFTFLMKSYNQAAEEVGSGFDMNPSPGNIRDGLITDAIKSLGAAQKGGRSPVKDVLDYTEQVTEDGLSLLCTPGNDVESTTGLAGSGANVLLFTTGLGTPTGNPVAPTVKISSNTKLADNMPDIIDYNTGPIIDGTASLEEVATGLMKTVIDVASGKKRTKAELLNQDDFIPWKRGVSL
ncbi:UxaA family hydrolase [Membranicola marinus]|uniref:UxaA family hydrolase n=2 Tax=Membranihabitans marinus TaxID=1227546 RepID=A0A953I0X2_9BACT|nr:UxaA family hydrolase [Membranihabitans marinus]